jgi:hypothetical protein
MPTTEPRFIRHLTGAHGQTEDFSEQTEVILEHLEDYLEQTEDF